MRRFLLALAVLTAAIAVPTAGASVIIDRSATNWTPADVQLSVNAKGEALVSYSEGGQAKHVLAWGAVNALQPTPSGQQVNFQLDYAGGWGKYYLADPAVKGLQTKLNALKKSGQGYLNTPEEKTLSAKANYAKTYWDSGFAGSCTKYDGPALAWFVEACKAPDGSYWALQSWQRALPDYGVAASSTQSLYELHLSHWTGALPTLTISTDWSYAGKWDHLFGSFTYNGVGVAGFKSTPQGVPLDTFGRNVYVDTFDSAYGTGWTRENSFLTHTGTGSFCYSVNPHGAHPTGKGSMYRATIQGPGVIPDIMWQGNAPGTYSKTAQVQADAAILALHDPQCQPTDH